MLPDHDIAFTDDALYKDVRTAGVGDRLRRHITHIHLTLDEHHSLDHIVYSHLHVVHHGRPKDSPDSAKITGLSKRTGHICTRDVVYVYSPALTQFMLTYA